MTLRVYMIRTTFWVNINKMRDIVQCWECDLIIQNRLRTAGSLSERLGYIIFWAVRRERKKMRKEKMWEFRWDYICGAGKRVREKVIVMESKTGFHHFLCEKDLGACTYVFFLFLLACTIGRPSFNSCYVTSLCIASLSFNFSFFFSCPFWSFFLLTSLLF